MVFKGVIFLAKKTRTITMDDDIFNALKALSIAYGNSVSGIIEDLARKFIKDNSAKLQDFYRQQIKPLAQE